MQIILDCFHLQALSALVIPAQNEYSEGGWVGGSCRRWTHPSVEIVEIARDCLCCIVFRI